MLSKMSGFLSRHKKKIIITSVVIGAGGLLINYAKRRLIAYQEAKAKEFLEQTKRLQHFEATEKACNLAIQSLHSNIIDVICKIYDIDTSIERLRKDGPTLTKQEKVELWKHILTMSFGRLVTLVYASAIFVVTMRVQLNILGGYMLKEVGNEHKQLTKDVQNRYLSLIQSFLGKGIYTISDLINMHSEAVLSKYDLKQKLTLADLETIFTNVQASVNNDLESKSAFSLAKLVMHPDEQGFEGEPLHKMVIETVDFLETDEVFSLLSQNIQSCFSVIVDKVSLHFGGDDKQQSLTKFDQAMYQTPLININQVKIPLAKIIPMLNGLIPRTDNGKTLSSDILRLLINSDKLKVLGANVYEVFCR